MEKNEANIKDNKIKEEFEDNEEQEKNEYHENKQNLNPQINDLNPMTSTEKDQNDNPNYYFNKNEFISKFENLNINKDNVQNSGFKSDRAPNPTGMAFNYFFGTKKNKKNSDFIPNNNPSSTINLDGEKFSENYKIFIPKDKKNSQYLKKTNNYVQFSNDNNYMPQPNTQMNIVNQDMLYQQYNAETMPNQNIGSQINMPNIESNIKIPNQSEQTFNLVPGKFFVIKSIDDVNVIRVIKYII